MRKARIWTREQSQKELEKLFPQMKGNFALFERILDHMDAVDPEKADETHIFRRHHGFAGHNPMMLTELAIEFRVKPSSMKTKYRRVITRLFNPKWWDESQWPRPQIDMTLPRMTKAELGSAAVKILQWLYENTSHREYTIRLRAACKALRMSEDDMQRIQREIARLDKK